MGGVVTVQNPSGCFSMSTFGPLQKLSFTFVASGALKRIWTRELLSTRGYCASRTFDVAGLKSPESCAKQKLAAKRITIPICLTATSVGDISPRQNHLGAGSTCTLRPLAW